MTKITHHNKGFSLIEVLIYLGIFTTIITGSVVSVYNIVQNSEKLQTKVLAQQETDFIFNKIQSLLLGASSFTVGTSPAILTIINQGSTYVFSHDPSNYNVTLKRGNATPTQLNNTAVKVNSLQFQKTVGPPDKLQTDITIEGTSFKLIQYLR